MAEEQNITPEEKKNAPVKHSALGISSFVIGILQSLLTFSIIFIAGLTYNNQPENQGVIFTIVGLLIFGGIFIHLIGTGLGIAGLVQKNRKKIFSILGLIFNISCILIVLLLILVGITFGRS